MKIAIVKDTETFLLFPNIVLKDTRRLCFLGLYWLCLGVGFVWKEDL